jgi:DNA-binding LacI/PurR family transcriptional regulator
VQLEGDDPTPNLGYTFAKQLLFRNQLFTAMFAYNDISAIGSFAAFQEVASMCQMTYLLSGLMIFRVLPA